MYFLDSQTIIKCPLLLIHPRLILLEFDRLIFYPENFCLNLFRANLSSERLATNEEIFEFIIIQISFVLELFFIYFLVCFIFNFC